MIVVVIPSVCHEVWVSFALILALRHLDFFHQVTQRRMNRPQLRQKCRYFADHGSSPEWGGLLAQHYLRVVVEYRVVV